MKERLTKKGGLNFADKDLSLVNEWGYSYIYNRLAELEDKMEQGLLVELDMKLPFKVGKTAYWLNGLPNCIQEYKVLGYNFDLAFGLRVDLSDMQPILCRCFGKTLFASREEAEKRLEELNNG